MSLRSKVATVVDNGLFIEVARTLAEGFGKVNYVRPAWLGPFPSTADFAIGRVPELHYVDSAEQVFEETDTFVYPDIYLPHQQRLFARLGKDVWGSRLGEQLETLRVKSKQALRDAGIPVKTPTILTGTTALEDYLRHHGECWIKGDSKTRGDFESKKSLGWTQVKEWFYRTQAELGEARERKVFVIEQPIEGVEIAYDCYNVSGVYPSRCTIGKEQKGQGYIGRFMPYADVPAPLQLLNEKLSPLYKAYGYSNMSPVEAIIDKAGTPWVIDPCMRFPSPPTEGLLCQYKNWPAIIEAGARGECVDPEARAEWVAEILIHSGDGVTGWIGLTVPEDLRLRLKLRNYCQVGKTCWVVPQQSRHTGVGAAVGLGGTMKEAIAKAKAAACETMKLSDEITCEPQSLDQAEEVIAELADYGMKL